MSLGPVTDPLNDPVFEAVGICHTCAHRKALWPATCKAFPEGIPKEIFVGEVMHTSPYPGDGGVIYKQLMQ